MHVTAQRAAGHTLSTFQPRSPLAYSHLAAYWGGPSTIDDILAREAVSITAGLVIVCLNLLGCTAAALITPDDLLAWLRPQASSSSSVCQLLFSPHCPQSRVVRDGLLKLRHDAHMMVSWLHA